MRFRLRRPDVTARPELIQDPDEASFISGTVLAIVGGMLAEMAPFRR